MSAVIIKDIGPIHELSIPIQPGVVILRGVNGAGKSEAIKAIKTALTGAGSLEKRDGVASPGRLEGMGIKITVGKRTTRTGELEVISLEDRLSIMDVVDPKIKDPVAADAKRIKAILSLTNVRADFSLFKDLLPKDGMIQCTQASSRAATDIVDMAAFLKRDLEAAARTIAAQAEQDEGAAKACAPQAYPVGFMESESDTATLQASHTDAVRKLQAIITRLESAQDADVARDMARKELSEAEQKYIGLTVEQAQAKESAANESVVLCQKAIADLEKKMVMAKLQLQLAEYTVREAVNEKRAASAHEAFIGTCRKAVEAAPIDRPSNEERIAAQKAVDDASAAIERGVQIRTARQRAAEYEKHAKAAEQNRADSQAIRTAAQGVEAILSNAVAVSGLRVADGRIISGGINGEVLFARLSEGQRYRIALDIAIDAGGERCLIAVDEGWEALDPANQEAIAEHVQERGATLLVVKPDRGALRAEMFNPEPETTPGTAEEVPTNDCPI